jgi:hypothetical protein
MQPGRRPISGREGAGVEVGKHRIQRGGGGLASALTGGGDSPLADGFRVAGGHPKAVAGEGCAQ